LRGRHRDLYRLHVLQSLVCKGKEKRDLDQKTPNGGKKKGVSRNRTRIHTRCFVVQDPMTLRIPRKKKKEGIVKIYKKKPVGSRLVQTEKKKNEFVPPLSGGGRKTLQNKNERGLGDQRKRQVKKKTRPKRKRILPPSRGGGENLGGPGKIIS